MKWLNTHSVCFLVGLILTVAGILMVYRPAAPITAGLIFMAISIFGIRPRAER